MKKSFETLIFLYYILFLFPSQVNVKIFIFQHSLQSQATRGISFNVNSPANSPNFILNYSMFNSLLVMTIIFKNYFLELIFLHLSFMQNSLLDFLSPYICTFISGSD